MSGAIGAGLCVLVGVTHDDTPRSADKLAEKIWFLRVLDDADGVMNRSLADRAADGQPAEVLVVSQFTLYGNTDKGRRPSWIDAARPEHAEPLVDAVVAKLRAARGHGGDRPVPHRHARRARERRPRHGAARAVARSSPRRAMREQRRARRAPTATVPSVWNHVVPSRSGTSVVITACSLMPVRCCTSPPSVTNAVKPVGDTCTTQRPFSTARSRLDATCWVCRTVPV